MYLSGGPAASNRQVRYEFEITKNNNIAFKALHYFDTTFLCIQGVRPRRHDHGLRNRCLNLHCLQVIIENLVVSKAANQVRALNLYTPCLSTHHLQLAPPTALTPAETLIWVSKHTNELNETILKGAMGINLLSGRWDSNIWPLQGEWNPSIGLSGRVAILCFAVWPSI